MMRLSTILPWIQSINPTITPEFHSIEYNFFPDPPEFSSINFVNRGLNFSTKLAAMRTSPSVVSIVTYSGHLKIFQGSGIIIGEDGTLFTSTKLVTCPTTKNVVAKDLKVIVHLCNGKSYEAEILTHDFYYGITALRIREDVPLLKPACLRLVDDCLLIDPSQLLNQDDKEFQPRHHSDTHHLIPGDLVIALGRSFRKPYDLMAAPGAFSIKRCEDYYKCEVLLMSTCQITSSGIGGPLINRYGEVIGISLDEYGDTYFLPINIVLKWWEHYKKSGKLPMRPLLGMRMANFYTTDLQVMEKLIEKFPNNFAGVIVEEVKQGSSGDVAGICPNDLIVGCCGKTIRGFLELYDMMWDNVGDSVQLVVLRASNDAPLHLTMDVVDATHDGIAAEDSVEYAESYESDDSVDCVVPHESLTMDVVDAT